MREKAEKIMGDVGLIGQQLREDMLADLTQDQRDALVASLSTVKTRLVRLLEAR